MDGPQADEKPSRIDPVSWWHRRLACAAEAGGDERRYGFAMSPGEANGPKL